MHEVMLGDRALTPSKIVCVGRNYVAHIEELGNEVPDAMVVFGKPNSARVEVRSIDSATNPYLAGLSIR